MRRAGAHGSRSPKDSRGSRSSPSECGVWSGQTRRRSRARHTARLIRKTSPNAQSHQFAPSPWGLRADGSRCAIGEAEVEQMRGLAIGEAEVENEGLGYPLALRFTDRPSTNDSA